MTRSVWPLADGRPVIEIVLQVEQTGQSLSRRLLADTGAGSAETSFELVLDEEDCLLCGGQPYLSLTLRGAYAGRFPVYTVRVQIPQLGFVHWVRCVGVPEPPPKLDGIACFRFLNRFTYGNFGKPDAFGLEG